MGQTPKPRITPVQDPGIAALFEPRSVALLGISSRPDSYTSRVLQYLKQAGYAGHVHLVNPRYTELHGLPCQPSLESIEGPVDLVINMLPAAAAEGAVASAGSLGVKAMMVFAAGFAETGREGSELQSRIVQTARSAGMRILGPNCQGAVNFHTGFVGSFSRAMEYLPSGPGSVAYLGQSGAIGGSLLNLAQERGLGWSLWASTGNQADVTVLDLANYALGHEQTAVLALYIEDVEDGWKFGRVVAAARGRGKPIVLLRSGRTAVGRVASQSHTGALLAGDMVELDLLAERYGVISVRDVDEFLDAAHALSALPRSSGGCIAAITTSGGIGALVADFTAEAGMEMAELEMGTISSLQAQLPEFAAFRNPVDVTYQFFSSESPFLDKVGGTSPMQDLCRTLAADPGVDSLLLVLTNISGAMATALAEDVVSLSGELTKPLLCTWVAGRELMKEARDVLREAHLPVFPTAAAAVRAAGWLRPPPVGRSGEIERPVDSPRRVSHLSGPNILDLIGIAQPEYTEALTAAEADALATRLAEPLALKLDSPSLPHKSDAMALRLGLSRREIRDAAAELLALASSLGLQTPVRLLLQEMARSGFEMLLSVRWLDVRFPPVLTVGAGGMTTEIARDVVSEVFPTDAGAIAQRLTKLRCAAVLAGFRGQPPLDVEAVATAGERLLAFTLGAGGAIKEVEINPLIVYRRGEGVSAVDVLVGWGAARVGPNGNFA